MFLWTNGAFWNYSTSFISQKYQPTHVKKNYCFGRSFGESYWVSTSVSEHVQKVITRVSRVSTCKMKRLPMWKSGKPHITFKNMVMEDNGDKLTNSAPRQSGNDMLTTEKPHRCRAATCEQGFLYTVSSVSSKILTYIKNKIPLTTCKWSMTYKG